jgi:hypothetical protein
MAKHSREELKALRTLLSHKNEIGEAMDIVRNLIEKIVLSPVEGKKDLSLDLYGDLAGILSIAAKEKSMPRKCKKPGKIASNDNVSGPSAKLVAGAGFEPTTFGL